MEYVELPAEYNFLNSNAWFGHKKRLESVVCVAVIVYSWHKTFSTFVGDATSS
jgi:uncharacterized protein (DUF486 family)